MPRLPRPDFEGTYHHIVVKGVDGLPIFDSDRKKQQYIHLMKSVREEHDLSVYALGFMNNHLHQFIRRNSQSMGIFYRRVNGRFSQWYNSTYDRSGKLYDDRYFSSLVDSDTYFHAVWRYSHKQGVKAGIYDRPADDPWSSAGMYLGTSTRFKWIDWEEAIEELGVDSSGGIRALMGQEGPESGWYDEEKEPFERHREQRFIADKDYVEKYMQIREQSVRKKTRQESPYEWETLVDIAVDISELERLQLLEPSQKPVRVKYRSGLAYAGRRYGHLPLSTIAEKMGVTIQAISKMVKRAKKKYPELKKEWDDRLAS